MIGKTKVFPQDEKTGKNLEQVTKQPLLLFCLYKAVLDYRNKRKDTFQNITQSVNTK